MTQRNMKKTTIILTVAMFASMATSATACECLDNLLPWNWGKNNDYAATTYAPLFQASDAPTLACCPTTTCATTRTACYVPQTCYQTVYRTVPVTSCQAVNGCDPCTGCPVTYYRPIVSYQKTAQLVPYTTYRMVWQNTPTYYTGYYAGCCTSCGDSGCYSGCCGSDCGVTTSGCSSCTSNTTTTTTVPNPQAEPTPTYADPRSQQPTGGSGEWDSKRPVDSDDVSPMPKPEPTTTRQDYRSNPFQIPPSLSPPAGRTASYVRHASYETRTSSRPEPTKHEQVPWRAVER